MTELTTVTPPTIGDLVATAAAADAEQRRVQREKEEQDRIRLVQKAAEHVIGLLGLAADQGHLLMVTLGNTDADAGTTITYTPPGDEDNPIHFLWHPFRSFGFEGGYEEAHVTVLVPCQMCGGLVAAHNPAYWPRDAVSLGRLLIEDWDAKHDRGHHEDCPKAWREDEDPPTSPGLPAKPPTTEELLARIAAALEELVARS